MRKKPYPSLALSTLVVLLLMGTWAGLRLFVFKESILPLTYVLPLLVCIWTRRRWHLWLMTAAFAVKTAVKSFWLLPGQILLGSDQVIYFSATLFNIFVGAVVIHFIMTLREGLEARNAKITAQNAELEAQAEELAQQNEEIRAQAEELAQQNEEIESQAEELERQNEELQQTNKRLGSREAMLQAVLKLSRVSGGARQALDEVCRHALEILDAPAEALAVLELNDQDGLRLRAHARHELQPPPREEWPLENSLARVVLRKNQTAYVDDLRERADLAAPFAADGMVRSLMMTPLHVAGEQAGVVVACARSVSHWTNDQCRLIEWAAAQCGLILEGLRWQNALEARTAEVEAANRTKDEFLAMLSHELRTPLTPVLAAAGALETDPRLPEDTREDIAAIRRNIGVQSRLIDDLLDLTRLGRGKIELHRQVLNVPALLRDTAAIVATELDAREQTLTLQIDVPDDCAVIGDGPRLQQVFWNLLKNAIKFSPVRSKITLTARQIDGSAPRVSIAVSDDGIGIDPVDIERIFHPFEQATLGRRSGSSQGLGLGLYIAKAVIELHGGSMLGASDGLGHGATFTVELPICEAASAGNSQGGPDRAATATTADDSSASTLRILLVEDHADTGRLLTRILKNQGHAVEHVRDIASATESLSTTTFDLVVSDLGLPDGSGLDLMKHIRESQPDLVAICLSGFGMERDVQASLDAGFCEHLTKPVDIKQLYEAISRVAPRSGSATRSH